ncbi:MAG TPA: hypothetical protein VJN63_03930 [Thermoplasmata archaeon]|nr:hypothetical protein [Thermoplasmata archaeon]
MAGKANEKKALILKARVEKELLSIRGVSGVDVGFQRKGGKPTKTIAIRVFVRPQERDQRDHLEGEVAKVVKGFPFDLVEERFEPLFGTRTTR